MRFDCHIHSNVADSDRSDLPALMKKAGYDGGVIFSHSPAHAGHDAPPPERRIDAVLKLTASNKYLFPFYFINPTEPDALEQVALACRKGIMGFKVICYSHYPGDERALPVYREIAKTGKPVLFHSGILYDGRNDSGSYQRPCNFEFLITIDKLRFALAHVSWPWTDECIALFGKFNATRRSGDADCPEMFIDNTPGTPAPYRKPMYDRLLFSGYKIKGNLLFGTDAVVSKYDPSFGESKIAFDEGIFSEYKLDDDFLDCLYYKNLLRFVGLPENY